MEVTLTTQATYIEDQVRAAVRGAATMLAREISASSTRHRSHWADVPRRTPPVARTGCHVRRRRGGGLLAVRPGDQGVVDRMELTLATRAHGPAGGPGLDSVLGTDWGARVTGVALDHGVALAELKARMVSATSCSRLSDHTAVPVDPAHAWDCFDNWPDARPLLPGGRRYGPDPLAPRALVPAVPGGTRRAATGRRHAPAVLQRPQPPRRPCRVRPSAPWPTTGAPGPRRPARRRLADGRPRLGTRRRVRRQPDRGAGSRHRPPRARIPAEDPAGPDEPA